MRELRSVATSVSAADTAVVLASGAISHSRVLAVAESASTFVLTAALDLPTTRQASTPWPRYHETAWQTTNG